MPSKYKILKVRQFTLLLFSFVEIVQVQRKSNYIFQTFHKILHKNNFSQLIVKVCCHFILIGYTVLQQKEYFEQKDNAKLQRLFVYYCELDCNELHGFSKLSLFNKT